MRKKQIIFTNHSDKNFEIFLDSIRHEKPLTTEKEYDLWTRMRNGSTRAREQLIYANLLYVVSVAKSFQWSGVPLMDLIQAGCEGMVKAVDKFDASLGFRLISYATWYVENEVRNAASDYLRHKHESLDEPRDADKDDGETRGDYLPNWSCQSTDWNIRYLEALNDLKRRVEERQSGLGHLVGHLHQMLLEGHTTSEFARRHHLNEKQMTRLFTVLREEASLSRAT